MHHIRLPKRLLSTALAAALALTPAAAFSDTSGHWAETSIAKWSEEYSIIQGYEDGTFRPDQSITRGAFAGIMDRFLQFQSISGPDTFSDIAGNYWENAILKLHAAGVYLGNNGKALAGDTITRQQAVAMIARAFQIEASAIDLPYGDAGQIADYAAGPVSEMTIRGYITDCWDGNFRPQEPITRAEIINILSNMIQTLIQNTSVYSGDVQGTLMINAPDGASLENMTIYGDLILAPGVTGTVTLTNVEVMGSIRNFSRTEPVYLTAPEEPEKPTEPETPAETATSVISHTIKNRRGNPPILFYNVVNKEFRAPFFPVPQRSVLKTREFRIWFPSPRRKRIQILNGNSLRRYRGWDREVP